MPEDEQASPAWLEKLHPADRVVAERWLREVGAKRFGRIARAFSGGPGAVGVDQDRLCVEMATLMLLPIGRTAAATRVAKRVFADADWGGRDPSASESALIRKLLRDYKKNSASFDRIAQAEQALARTRPAPSRPIHRYAPISITNVMVQNPALRFLRQIDAIVPPHMRAAMDLAARVQDLARLPAAEMSAAVNSLPPHVRTLVFAQVMAEASKPNSTD